MQAFSWHVESRSHVMLPFSFSFHTRMQRNSSKQLYPHARTTCENKLMFLHSSTSLTRTSTSYRTRAGSSSTMVRRTARLHHASSRDDFLHAPIRAQRGMSETEQKSERLGSAFPHSHHFFPCPSYSPSLQLARYRGRVAHMRS